MDSVAATSNVLYIDKGLKRGKNFIAMILSIVRKSMRSKIYSLIFRPNLTLILSILKIHGLQAVSPQHLHAETSK